MQRNILSAFSRKLWDKIGELVNGALVYMNDCAAECLHWNGGLEHFLQIGAHGVHRFQVDENCNGYWDEVAFILGGPITDENLETLKSILTNSQFIKCTVIISDSMHPAEIRTLEEDILDWMGSKKFESSVIWLSMFLACVSPDFFVMPPFAELFPPLDTAEQNQPGQNKTEPIKNLFDSTEDELYIKSLGCCLDGLLTQLDVREEVFAWGQLSHAVGSELLKLPNAKNRRKKSSRPGMSIIILDGTLDLSSSLSQQSDCLLDCVVRCLPALPGHACSCDVAVDMFPLFYPRIHNVDRESSGISPGCLAGLGPSSILSIMLTSKPKEGLMEVNRQLVSSVSQQGAVKAIGGRITPESLLEKIQAAFHSKGSCLEVLQQSLAVVQCLQSPAYEKAALMLSTEKLLQQNLLASQEGPTRNLMHIMAHRKDRHMTLEDIVLLLAHLFSVGENSLWNQKDEMKLQGALAEAVFQDLDHLPEFLNSLIGDVTQESNVLAAVSQVFKHLKTIGKSRLTFKKYKSVLSQENPALPAVYRSVFQQLMGDVLDPSRPDIPDLQCLSTGLTDILKSGLGLFMNVQKPHPGDNVLLMVIVLGGIPGSEVKLMQDTVKSTKRPHQLIVGSTRIGTPINTLEAIFKP